MQTIKELSNISLFLFDMDGTLYLGDRLYPFTKELLAEIRRQGKHYLFMTNNSSKSVADYVKKLAKLGIEATEEDFMTSSQATAYYLNLNHKDAYIYASGTESLIAELRRCGINVTTEYDESIDCIVMGFDTELTFKKLENLSRLLHLDVPYLATNPDLVCPTEFGSVPDCGSVSEMLYNATSRRPTFIGKPSPLMVELAMKKMGVGQGEAMVVGDRIYTDIECGLRAGICAVLVMSGETTKDILDASERKPTYVLEDGGELLSQLKAL